MFNSDNLAPISHKFAAISKAFNHVYGAVEAKYQSRKSTDSVNPSALGMIPYFPTLLAV